MLNFRSGNFCKVCLADNESFEITSMGDINLKTFLGTIWTLKDIRFIHSLKRMLIFVRQLDDQEYCTIFKDGKWKIVKGSLVVALS